MRAVRVGLQNVHLHGRANPPLCSFLAHGRAARGLCAVTNVTVGDENSGECPAGYAPIMDEAECRSAATLGGLSIQSDFKQSNPTLPRGCHKSVQRAYFNTHPTGAARPSSEIRILCAPVSTEAPTAIGTHALLR